MLRFTNEKNSDQIDCLRQILRNSSWQKYPSLPSEMVKISEVSTTSFNNKGLKDYVYILEGGIDWCGTAGCKLLIAERLPNGDCHLLYEAAGDTTFTVLRRRDHGYKRIYTPCEARFDGQQYQPVHEDCPSPLTPR